jgi:hypothetical protein
MAHTKRTGFSRDGTSRCDVERPLCALAPPARNAAWHEDNADGTGTRGRIERTRDLAGDLQLLVPLIGMRRQGSGKQGLRIGVEPLCAEFEAVRELHDLPETHDRNTVADMSHRRQIMTDKQVADAQGLLQVFELVHDLPSAETGSSSTISRVFVASALAIAIRWRWPPLNSCGKSRATSGCSPTSSEISPAYVDVILRRWQSFSGRTAVHQASGQSFDERAEGRERDQSGSADG